VQLLPSFIIKKKTHDAPHSIILSISILAKAHCEFRVSFILALFLCKEKRTHKKTCEEKNVFSFFLTFFFNKSLSRLFLSLSKKRAQKQTKKKQSSSFFKT